MSDFLLADVLPEMPKDWLPDKVLVTAEQTVNGRTFALAFTFKPEMLDDHEFFRSAMAGLQAAFWECIHAKPEFWIAAEEQAKSKES